MNNLRMLASAIGLTILLVSSGAYGSSFIIELQSGREVVTSHVWEEGEEIKFYTSQGTAGVPKALVKRIKTSSITYREKVSRSPLPPSTTEARASTSDKPSQAIANRDADIQRDAGNGQSSHEKKSEGAKSLTAGDVRTYHAKKVMLTAELDAATNRYLAASGAKNPDAKKAALDDMRAFSTKIIELGDEVKKKNGGMLPDWWNE
jgi:hypothetical protein